MKRLKIILSLIILVSVGFSFQVIKKEEPIIVQSEKLSKEFLSKEIPIIDIRTEQDWETTAVLKDSILMTFYKKDGRYDERFFIRNLNTIIDKNSDFAILSRTGERSEQVAKLLKSKGFENVINLEGGIREGIKNHVQFVKYHN